MKGRLKNIRKHFNLNQKEMGDKIKLSQTHISSLENGAREITDRIIYDICREFNLNEDWMRTGKGEMLVRQLEFSLDQYAEKNKISPLEIDIIKSYMEVDANIREGIISHFKGVFASHAETAAIIEEDPIDAEVEAYRRELEAVEKGATFSASPERSEPS